VAPSAPRRPSISVATASNTAAGGPLRRREWLPPQRRLFVCEALYFCLGTAALGHVASDGVHEPVLDIGVAVQSSTLTEPSLRT
jgi:hypothetical protein